MLRALIAIVFMSSIFRQYLRKSSRSIDEGRPGKDVETLALFKRSAAIQGINFRSDKPIEYWGQPKFDYVMRYDDVAFKMVRMKRRQALTS